MKNYKFGRKTFKKIFTNEKKNQSPKVLTNIYLIKKKYVVIAIIFFSLLSFGFLTHSHVLEVG